MNEETINIIYSLFMFIIGTLFGSFLSLATYRIPRKEDIWIKHSYCPSCKHKLGFFDCFPILSYISTIGRCKYCFKVISFRYIIIEIFSGFVFLILYLLLGFSQELFVLLACYVYLFIYIGSDIMKAKMTEQEKKDVQMKIENKKKKKVVKKEKKINDKVKKKGAINIEILVAVIIFLFYFASTLFIMRNYSSTLMEYKRKSDALNLCINQINISKATSFNELVSTSGSKELEGHTYEYEVSVSGYLKDGYIEIPNAKEIIVTVNYYINGQINKTELKAIKVENNI